MKTIPLLLPDSQDAKVGADQDILVCVMISFLNLNLSSLRAINFAKNRKNQKENPQQLSTQFVRVESIEEYTKKAKGLGARVVRGKLEISEAYYAVLEDPQKNTIGIWQEK